MAPILKEAETPAGATTATTTVAPPAPAAKSPNETPTRPQPVPLEIPVTVNGARTVAGSDKREPFAETTQTVLVFPHGAVIRIATPLAPGQLVFVTNEKTKKEVVCQVVKSKSGGSASGYVELQFTEPAPAFWGLHHPGAVAPPSATAPAMPRPAATTPAPRAVPPAPQPVAPPPVQASVPGKPAPAPPVLPAAPVIPAPIAPPQQSVTPVLPAPKLPDPAPLSTAVPVHSTLSAPLVSPPPPSPISAEPPSPPVQKPTKPLIPAPSTGPRDYSKEIDSLFAVPQAPQSSPVKPAAPAIPPPPPVSSLPSTEELKQQAARLQEKLSAMLFTEAPAAATSPAVPFDPKPSVPLAEVANKLIEIVQDEPSPVTDSAAKPEVAAEPKLEIKAEPKPAVPSRVPAFPAFSAKDEEVEVPAWLRPLSQHSETVVETPTPEPASSVAPASESVNSPESGSVDFSPRSEAAVFGGQLLAGDSSAEPATASGSKKGLFFGFAAAAVLLAAGGYWYYQQNYHPATTTPQAARPSSAPALSEPVAAPPSPAVSTEPSHPATNTPASSNSTNPASVPAPRTSAPPASPAPASAENRRGPESRNTTPVEEPAKKPSLGQVHLAAPVIRGAGEGHASGEPLPSIDAPVANSGADALAAVAHRKAPAVPLPIGGDVKPAQLTKSVPPIYPQVAKTQRISGNVTLDALIDASGNVAQVKVISGPPLLHQAALDAVKQWKYSPALLDGNPTSMHLTVTVQFRTQ